MRITIIEDEELTQKILPGFENDFDVNGLRRTVNVLVNDGVDTLATNCAIVDLNRLPMVA